VKRSTKRKLFFSGLITVAFFSLLELALWMVGVRPASQQSDPLVGFSGHSRLFTESPEASESGVLTTAENRTALFNRQSFPRHKPPGTFRIFCLGGSTTYGRPYDDRTSFAGFLRAFLPEMDPTKDWEVINAGGISYASYRIEVLTRELAEYEPDLFVIYTGHNEFLESRTYESLIDTSEPVRRVIELTSKSRTFSLLQRLIKREPSADGDELLPEDVDAILDRSVGPDAYHRDETWRADVLTHFETTLERMVDIAEDADARVICVVPASNLRDCAPFKSEHQNGLSNVDLRRFTNSYGAAEAARKAGEVSEALRHVDQAISIDPQYAKAHFLRGRLLLEAGKTAEARAAFLQAREEDICPLRAFDAIEQSVRDVAHRRSLLSVDYANIIGRKSQDTIPGTDWFLDHVHPTIDGHRLLAEVLADELVAQSMVNPKPTWKAETFQSIAESVEASVDPHDHAVALRNLAKVLSWAGKTEEADRLATQAVALLADDEEAQSMAGFAKLRLGEIDDAKRHFEAALRVQPHAVRALVGLGDVYTRLGNIELARDSFQRAIEADPAHVPAFYNLGNALRSLGNYEGAVVAYRSALELASGQPDTHKNLGLALFALGDLAGTVRHFESALALEPDVPQRHADLGYVLIDAGDPRRAASEFQAALAIDPGFVPAMFGTALLHEQNGEFARATEVLDQAVRVAPNDVNLHFNLARYALQRGDPAAARRELDIVLRLDAGHAEARQLRASLD